VAVQTASLCSMPSYVPHIYFTHDMELSEGFRSSFRAGAVHRFKSRRNYLLLGTTYIVSGLNSCELVERWLLDPYKSTQADICAIVHSIRGLCRCWGGLSAVQHSIMMVVCRTRDRVLLKCCGMQTSYVAIRIECSPSRGRAVVQGGLDASCMIT
jgi:hypothetical protein